MRNTITKILALAVSLLCLLALAACPPDASPTGDTGTVEITNIPLKVRPGEEDSYKIFIQLSEGNDSDVDPIALGSAKIDGKDNVTLTLHLYDSVTKKESNTPWNDSGTYNVAVTISPQSAPSWEQIVVNAGQGLFSGKTVLQWDKLLFIDMGKKGIFSFWGVTIDGPDRVSKIYDGIIKEDPDINTSTTP
jgi:hypothetical protein